jgi:hypothetical protein
MGEGKSGIDRVDLVVCRGCCCGTDKHPDVDSAAHLAEIHETAAALPNTRVLVADCLNRCDFSNVVAVRHRPAQGKPRTLWLGGMLEDADISTLRTFVGELAAPDKPTADTAHPTPLPLPPTLERRRIPSPLEARQALQELIAAAGKKP